MQNAKYYADDPKKDLKVIHKSIIKYIMTPKTYGGIRANKLQSPQKESKRAVNK